MAKNKYCDCGYETCLYEIRGTLETDNARLRRLVEKCRTYVVTGHNRDGVVKSLARDAILLAKQARKESSK